MDKQKADLKKLIKPLIKECIMEFFVEQGLTKVISEAKQAAPSAPAPQKKTAVVMPRANPMGQVIEAKAAESKNVIIKELKQAGIMTEKFNPFANTHALDEAQAAPVDNERSRALNPLRDIDPSDPGVDISGIMGIAAGQWKAHLGRKNK
jgi:hypothetical protein